MQFLKRNNVFWRWEDDGENKYISFYFQKTQGIHVLNPVAALIFSYCDGDHTRSTIANKLCERFAKVDSKIIEADTNSFIEFLINENLILTTDQSQQNLIHD